jgi:TonB family protein
MRAPTSDPDAPSRTTTIEMPAAGLLAPWPLRNPGLWAAGALLVLGLVFGSRLLAPGRGLPFQLGGSTLSVTTEPPGATIILDGKGVGLAPVSAQGLAPGPHLVRVDMPGFRPEERSLDVRGTLPVALHFALRTLEATLEIDSQSGPAVVRVDGAVVASTPLKAPLTPGRHEVRLERQGFEPWSETFTVAPGEDVSRSIHLRSLSAAQSAGRSGWQKRGDWAELGVGVTPPAKISGDPPAKPGGRTARTVTVELTVTEDGKVEDPRVVESGGDALDRAALAAVASWRYQPAEKDGVQVRVRLRESVPTGAAHGPPSR